MYEICRKISASSRVSGRGIREEMATPEFKEEVYKLIHETVEDYTFPVCFGLPVGHVRNNFPLILGANVELIVHPKGAELHFP